MISNLSIMYDVEKVRDNQILLKKVVEPFLYDVIGKYEDLHNDYSNRVITPQVETFDINCESARYPNGIPKGTIMRFANKKGIDLVKLTEGTYFFRGFKRIRKPKHFPLPEGYIQS